MKPIYLGAGLALVINGLIVGIQYWGGWQGIEEPIPNSGLFFNKNLGSEASVLVLVGLAGYRLWILIPFVAVPLVTQPLSRGALVALGATSILGLFKWRPFIAVLASIIAVGILFRLSSFRLTNIGLRLDFWIEAYEHLTFWGHGLGSYFQAYPWFEFAHNDLLQVTYELGVPGAVLFVGFFSYCLASGPPIERLVLVAFLVEGCFGFPLYQPVTVFIAGTAAGHILYDRARVRGEQRDSQLRADAWALGFDYSRGAQAFFHRERAISDPR